MVTLGPVSYTHLDVYKRQGYHSMGLSGTLPAVFEKVRAGVVDFFVETLESNPASASAGTSTEQGGMQSGQGSGSITFN